jgi:hypothetical protein
MLLSAVPLVRCANCSTSTGDHLARIGVIVAGIGVIIAVIALGVAWAAWKIAHREHKEFMKQLNARARFKLTAHALNAAPVPDSVEVPHRGATSARIQIGLANTGTRAAHATTITVLIPLRIGGFKWTDSGGSSLLGTPRPIDEELDGEPCQSLTTEISIVKLKASEVVRWVEFRVDRDMHQVPVLIKAQSDDLPGDEAVLDYRISVEEESVGQ